VDNLLFRQQKMPPHAELVFPHLTRCQTRGCPKHGLETRATLHPGGRLPRPLFFFDLHQFLHAADMP
jgi:hypothetical protein